MLAKFHAFAGVTNNMGTLSIAVSQTNVTGNFYNGAGVFYNGSVNILASGGTLPYTYSLVGWYQQNNGFFPLLPPGSYTAIATDATGQSVSAVVTLSSSSPIPGIAFSNVIPPVSCNSSDGSFTLDATDGTPPYVYSIDGGVTFSSLNTFNGLSWGVYICMVKDANNFIAVTQTSPVNYLNSVYFNCNCCSFQADVAAGVTSSCTDNIGQLDVNATGGTAPFLFSMDGINYVPGYTGYGGGWRFLNLPPGLYHGYAKDANGLISIGATVITSYCNLAINLVSQSSSCDQSNGSLTAHVSKGSSPYLFTMNGIDYQTDSTFTGLAAGVYTIGVKDNNGFFNSVRAELNDKCPEVTAVATSANCNNSNGSITATGVNGTSPYQFSIDGILFQTSNIFNNLGVGNYTVTIKDAGGFTSTYPVSVSNNCLALSLIVTNTTCSNYNGTITAIASNGAAPYQYSIDGVNFQFNNIFNNLQAGNYSVSVKDAASQTKTSVGIITDAPAPKTKISIASASCSNTNGSITISATGGTFPLLFSIDNGASFKPDNYFGDLDSGSYTTLTQDANGCTVADTVYLTALPTPTIFLGNDTTLCVGQTLTLVATTGNQYLWQDNSTANDFAVVSPGTYWVRITNGLGCSASDTMHVSYQSVPAFGIGNDTSICNGKTIVLQPAPELSQVTYLWNTGSTSASFTVHSSGLYWLQVSNEGCIQTDSIIISYKPSPVIDLGNDTTLCTGQVLLLNVTNNNATYSWQDGSVNPWFLVDSSGTYAVKVTEDGCDTAAQVQVNYLSKPVVNLGKDTSLCVAETLLLDVAYPHSTYEWQDGSISPQITITSAGTYIVDVTNSCGNAKDSIVITYENCACTFFMPSAFSPNHDGKNDLFLPKYTCLFNNYEIKIFNRWGQLVFGSSNPTNGWSGDLLGQAQPAGTYVWQMHYKDTLTGRSIYKSGTVVLIR